MFSAKFKDLFFNSGLVVNAILYFLIIFMWLSIPDEKLLNFATTIFNLSLTLLLVFLKKEKFTHFYQSEQFKTMVGVTINCVLVFFILCLINYVAFKFPWQKDTSLLKLNSLTSQSREVLKKIDEKIVFKIFAQKNEIASWLPLIELYRFENHHIEIDKVNIELRPDLVGEYNVQNSSTLVLEFKGRRQYVTVRDELNITNALVRLTRLADPVIYYLVGHGEIDPESRENEGLKIVLDGARNSALDIRPLNLSSAQEIPFDAKAIILWGPKSALMDNEVEIIKRFVNRGGGALIALDPNLNKAQFKNLENYLSTLGLIYHHNLIYDRKNFINGSKGAVPIASAFDPEHLLTNQFKGQLFFPLVSSVGISREVLNANPEVKFKELVLTNPIPDSWGETDRNEIAAESVFYTEGKDKPGPLAMVVSRETNKNRILFFGNSTFAMNNYIKFSSNMTFFLNSLSWVVGEDRLVSFNLPIIQSEQIFISENQLGAVFYFSVIFAPLVLIIISITIYRRRRGN